MMVSSLSKLLQFCNKLDPEYYVFSSENQKNYMSCVIHGTTRYNHMSITLSPNRLYLRGYGNTLCLKRIKYIDVGEEIRGVSVPFTVMCETAGGDEVPILIIAMLKSTQ